MIAPLYIRVAVAHKMIKYNVGMWASVENIAHDMQSVHHRTLDKFRGRRKLAAKELKISERTLYRKIKEYDIEA